MIVNLMIKIAMTIALMTTLIFGTSKFTEEYKDYQDDKTIQTLSKLAIINSEAELKEYKIISLDENLLLVEMNEDNSFEIHREYKKKSRNKNKSEEKLEKYDVIKTFSPKKEDL